MSRPKRTVEPSDEDRRQAAARAELQLRRDAAELGEELLEIWDELEDD